MTSSLNQMSNFSNHSNSTQLTCASSNSAHSHSHGSEPQMGAFHNFQPARHSHSMNMNMNMNMKRAQSFSDCAQYRPRPPRSYHQMLARSSTANINHLAELDEEQHIASALPLSFCTPRTAYEHKESTVPSVPSVPSAPCGARKAKELALFGGDVRAYNTWLACSCGREWVSYAALYSKVRAYFVETVGCSRAPQSSEVVPFFSCFGGADSSSRMDRAGFVALWVWLRSACEMVAGKELRSLWDDGLVDLFCRREECEARLRHSAKGTFTLRLSSRVPAG